ncbi:MAG: rod shape-determining protein RodA [Candidatus Pacebacteria bacterium]|nr:rod shape-determining protein RodA [Candidatus Paceibacterota bacterium]
MLAKLKSHLKKFDWILFLSVLLLCFFGLIEIYSIALGQETLSFLNFKKQIFFIGAGVILMFVVSFIDIYFLKSLRKYFYLGAVLILIAVLVFGSTIRGTTGWFNVLGFGIQPVEIVKVILLLVLAGYFSNLSTRVKSFGHLLSSGILAFGLAFLVILQPDFGSTFILLFVWFFLLLFSGFNKKYIIAVILAGAIIFSSLWLVFFKDYQKQRVLTFLNLNQSSLEEGYNVSQAIIAVGSGGLTGRGVGFGSQSQLKFLPEAQNDFVFAVISEELGFLGVSLLFLFFVVIFARLLIRIGKLKDDFAIYFVLGALGLIFIQMFINIGMNIGIFPVVGISLPFVSYGGSAILSSFILLGLLQNIIIQSKIKY